MLPSCLLKKSISVAVGMESLLETRRQTVPINSYSDGFFVVVVSRVFFFFSIVKHPGMWAASVHVFAPSLITPFPEKRREP